FELNRPMSQANAPAVCPAGHEDVVKLMSMVAVTGAASGGAAPQAGGGGGGCCGGGCCG
ncbi:zinc ribbon domain-containing protein, partial [Streptacidiphilus pinicola]